MAGLGYSSNSSNAFNGAALEGLLDQAADWLGEASGLLVTAGAGLGVDSGLPDFRGADGFWRAYPALGRAGMRFEQIADPLNFHLDPTLAWGVYGHRLLRYRHTAPNFAYHALKAIGDELPHGVAVFTSNVDGQFQQAGFSEATLVECHGSIHHLQCLRACSDHLWSADGLQPEVDEEACRLLSPLPECPHCGEVARPNILMFGDWHWLSHRTDAQYARLNEWLRRSGARSPTSEAPGGKRLCVVELGAGTAIPSVRRFGEQVCAQMGGRLIRINPREALVDAAGQIGLPLGAVEALRLLAQRLGGKPAALLS